ncbi:hypothetical protein ACHAWF_011184 [Thalassiosira exigua]
MAMAATMAADGAAAPRGRRVGVAHYCPPLSSRGEGGEGGGPSPPSEPPANVSCTSAELEGDDGDDGTQSGGTSRDEAMTTTATDPGAAVAGPPSSSPRRRRPLPPPPAASLASRNKLSIVRDASGRAAWRIEPSAPSRRSIAMATRGSDFWDDAPVFSPESSSAKVRGRGADEANVGADEGESGEAAATISELASRRRGSAEEGDGAGEGGGPREVSLDDDGPPPSPSPRRPPTATEASRHAPAAAVRLSRRGGGGSATYLDFGEDNVVGRASSLSFVVCAGARDGDDDDCNDDNDEWSVRLYRCVPSRGILLCREVGAASPKMGSVAVGRDAENCIQLKMRKGERKTVRVAWIPVEGGCVRETIHLEVATNDGRRWAQSVVIVGEAQMEGAEHVDESLGEDREGADRADSSEGEEHVTLEPEHSHVVSDLTDSLGHMRESSPSPEKDFGGDEKKIEEDVVARSHMKRSASGGNMASLELSRIEEVHEDEHEHEHHHRRGEMRAAGGKPSTPEPLAVDRAADATASSDSTPEDATSMEATLEGSEEGSGGSAGSSEERSRAEEGEGAAGAEEPEDPLAAEGAVSATVVADEYRDGEPSTMDTSAHDGVDGRERTARRATLRATESSPSNANHEAESVSTVEESQASVDEQLRPEGGAVGAEELEDLLAAEGVVSETVVADERVDGPRSAMDAVANDAPLPSTADATVNASLPAGNEDCSGDAPSLTASLFVCLAGVKDLVGDCCPGMSAESDRAEEGKGTTRRQPRPEGPVAVDDEGAREDWKARERREEGPPAAPPARASEENGIDRGFWLTVDWKEGGRASSVKDSPLTYVDESPAAASLAVCLAELKDFFDSPDRKSNAGLASLPSPSELLAFNYPIRPVAADEEECLLNQMMEQAPADIDDSLDLIEEYEIRNDKSDLNAKIDEVSELEEVLQKVTSPTNRDFHSQLDYMNNEIDAVTPTAARLNAKSRSFEDDISPLPLKPAPSSSKSRSKGGISTNGSEGKASRGTRLRTPLSRQAPPPSEEAKKAAQNMFFFQRPKKSSEKPAKKTLVQPTKIDIAPLTLSTKKQEALSEETSKNSHAITSRNKVEDLTEGSSGPEQLGDVVDKCNEPPNEEHRKVASPTTLTSKENQSENITPCSTDEEPKPQSTKSRRQTRSRTSRMTSIRDELRILAGSSGVQKKAPVEDSPNTQSSERSKLVAPSSNALRGNRSERLMEIRDELTARAGSPAVPEEKSEAKEDDSKLQSEGSKIQTPSSIISKENRLERIASIRDRLQVSTQSPGDSKPQSAVSKVKTPSAIPSKENQSVRTIRDKLRVSTESPGNPVSTERSAANDSKIKSTERPSLMTPTQTFPTEKLQRIRTKQAARQAYFYKSPRRSVEKAARGTDRTNLQPPTKVSTATSNQDANAKAAVYSTPKLAPRELKALTKHIDRQKKKDSPSSESSAERLKVLTKHIDRQKKKDSPSSESSLERMRKKDSPPGSDSSQESQRRERSGSSPTLSMPSPREMEAYQKHIRSMRKRLGDQDGRRKSSPGGVQKSKAESAYDRHISRTKGAGSPESGPQG